MPAMITYAIPLFVISLLGLYFSIKRRNLHYRASMFAAVGFGFLLLQGIQLAGLSIWIAAVAGGGEGPPATFAETISYWNLAGMIFSSIGLGAIARAVFVDRLSPRSASLHGRSAVPNQASEQPS
jgi:hypothetical protein